MDEILTSPLGLVIYEPQGQFQGQSFVSSVDILRKYSLVTLLIVKVTTDSSLGRGIYTV